MNPFTGQPDTINTVEDEVAARNRRSLEITRRVFN